MIARTRVSPTTRILIIHQGRLRADGSLSELLADAPGRRLVVCARVDAAALCQLVSDLDGVEPPRVTADAAGWATVEAEVARDADPRDATFERLQSAGVAIRDLTLVLPTLEKYFQSVTEGAPELQDAAEAGA